MSGLEWIVADTRTSYYDEDSKVRLTGHCPQCKRFFDIRAAAEYGGDAIMDFLVAIEEGHTIEIMTDHISMQAANRTKGHVASQGLQVREPQWVKNVPSKSSTFSLWVNSNVKNDFVQILDTVMHDGFDRSRIPEWHPTGSEEQFRGWLRELEVEAWKHGNEKRQRQGLPTTPNLRLESELWSEELQKMLPDFLAEGREAIRRMIAERNETER